MNVVTAPVLGRAGNLSERESAEFEVAARTLPGGVLGGNTLAPDVRFVVRNGSGSRFWDTSGNEYIDYVLGSGGLFLGHAHPALQKAIVDQVSKGTHYFAYLNEPAVELARRVTPYMRCAERVRFTTSGSESTFHAIRLARGFTGKNKILKFEGAYHGNHDYAQLSTSPKQTSNFPSPQPDTNGIPDVVQDLMLVAPFNDLDVLRGLLEAHAHELAAVIIEPIQRIISPLPGFLAGVRELTRKHGVLMILDEVVTGFRYGLGGAQEYFNITPGPGDVWENHRRRATGGGRRRAGGHHGAGRPGQERRRGFRVSERDVAGASAGVCRGAGDARCAGGARGL